MPVERTIQIPLSRLPNKFIVGELTIPEGAQGIVVFAHGSGSSRFSSRNRFVAQVLQTRGNLGTFLMDLLTPEEERYDDMNAQLRFDIPFLAKRVVEACRYLRHSCDETQRMPIGLFGASTGGGAALQAALIRDHMDIKAVVSRGGRPDLAGTHCLRHVQCPVLLLVGGNDLQVLELNRRALAVLQESKAATQVDDPIESRLDIIPGATHLFEEPGTLEIVAEKASDFFQKYLN